MPIRPANSKPYRLSAAYFATPTDIVGKVEKVLALSLAERARMGERARVAFLDDSGA